MDDIHLKANESVSQSDGKVSIEVIPSPLKPGMPAIMERKKKLMSPPDPELEFIQHYQHTLPFALVHSTF